MVLLPLVLLAIVGGNPTDACAYPSTASLGHCSGVLVHPRILLTAAHCFPEGAANVEVRFGEHRDTPVRHATAEYCVPFPAFTTSSLGIDKGIDWGYCWLSSAIRDVPYTPIANATDLATLELRGQFETVAVGFGRDEANVAGKKKEAVMNASRVVEGELFLTSNRGDNPCRGDSGGPVYAEVPNQGWRVVSTISYGPGCERWEATTVALGAVPWIRAETGINLALAPDVPRSLMSEEQGGTCAPLPSIPRPAATGTPSANWFPDAQPPPAPTADGAGCQVTSRTPMASLTWLLVFLATCSQARRTRVSYL